MLRTADDVARTMGDMKGAAMKLGQVLSTRPDLLGPAAIKELTKLQDAVPPARWEAIRAVLADELGGEPEQFFAHIDERPLAAASLAQVHGATLPGGEAVVVKIQRPRLRATIDTDLEILRDLASLAQRTAWGEVNNPQELVEEYAFTLLNELDYRREGRNADRFRANFAGEAHLCVPKIYWEYTTGRVLVMERIQGIKIDDLAALDAAGCDRQQVARNAASIIVKEMLVDG